MELNIYQAMAMTTCLPSSENFSYMMLNLVGEVGEFASKVAKCIRKEQMQIGMRQTNNDDDCSSDSCLHIAYDEFSCEKKISYEEFDEIKVELKKEAGDILWQLAGLCHVMGWPLEDVAQDNLEKLLSRKKRGVIDGNGDNR